MCFDLAINPYCGIIFRFPDFCKHSIYRHVVTPHSLRDCELNTLEGNSEKCFFCNLRNDGHERRGRSEALQGHSFNLTGQHGKNIYFKVKYINKKIGSLGNISSLL